MDALIENLFISRELYTTVFNRLCAKHGLTLAELMVLLFFANNVEYDTAKDIVKKLRVTKSQVSAAVRKLEQRGFLTCDDSAEDRRMIHLHVCPASQTIINEARETLENFREVIGSGFSAQELQNFQMYLRRVNGNINSYLNQDAKSRCGADKGEPI